MSSNASTPRTVLPPALRRPLGLAAAAAVLVLAVLAAMYATGASLGGFDGRALPLGALQSPWLDAALLIDFGAEPLGAVLLVAALVVACLLLRRPRTAVLAMTGPTLTVAVTSGLKPVVGRTIHGDHLAFPSGHTAMLTALALVVALLVVDHARPGPLTSVLVVGTAAVSAGAAMAWAQIALSSHYPTDTLGGFCAALAVVPATAWLIDRTARPPWVPARR